MKECFSSFTHMNPHGVWRVILHPQICFWETFALSLKFSDLRFLSGVVPMEILIKWKILTGKNHPI